MTMKLLSHYAPHVTIHLAWHVDARLLAGIASAVVLLALLLVMVLRSFRPSPEEQERRRREQLTSIGRITTGELLEARTLKGDESYSPTPEVLLYSYRLAGVTYSCAQDVSELPDRVRGFSIEGPVQVRYDPRNPCNSVLVSESWSGLWGQMSPH